MCNTFATCSWDDRSIESYTNPRDLNCSNNGGCFHSVIARYFFKYKMFGNIASDQHDLRSVC
jgi:hypothetical protein